jgi:hypothetical protein
VHITGACGDLHRSMVNLLNWRIPDAKNCDIYVHNSLKTRRGIDIYTFQAVRPKMRQSNGIMPIKRN